MKLLINFSFFFFSVLAAVQLKLKMNLYTWDKSGRGKKMKNVVKVLCKMHCSNTCFEF